MPAAGPGCCCTRRGRPATAGGCAGSTRGDRPELSHSTLRFLDPGSLRDFLAGAGLVIEEQFGDWGRQPLTEQSPEIITIARRA